MSRILLLKRNLLKLFFAVFFILSCSVNLRGQEKDYHSIAGKTYGERQLFLLRNFYVNDELRADSVKYFNEISQLLKVAEKRNDIELILECEFLKYNYLSSKNYRDYIPEVKAFLARVDESKIEHLQARTRQAIGFHYYYEKNDFGRAYIYFKDSYPYIQKLSLKELPDKQELLYNIAFINYNIGYELKALKYLEEAEKLDNNYYITLECNIINTKGLIYEREGNWKRALVNFQKTLVLANEIKNSIWVRIAKNNIAQTLLNQKNYVKAKEFLEESPKSDLSQSDEAGQAEAKRLMLLGKVYEAESNWASLSILTKRLNLLNSKFELSLNLKRDIYRLTSVDCKERGNFMEAYYYSDSAMEFATRYYKLKNSEGLKQALEKERIESLVQEQLKTEHQKKLNSRTRVLMFVISGLIILLSIISLRRQRIVYAKQKQEVESELSEAKIKLSELVTDLKSRNKEVMAYEEELEKLYQNTHEPQTIERKRTLEALLSKPIMTDSKWVLFKRAFDKAYPEYYHKLQKAIPGISIAETRYMYLRKLKLTPKEIIFILGVSQGSIRQYKHRIRNKIDTEFYSDFDEFLDNI